MSELELWAGVEPSCVRVGDDWVDQLALTGHDRRPDDLERIAALGVTTIRHPVLWEHAEAAGAARWALPDAGLSRVRELGLRPIVGLVHHGSGPCHTSLLDDSFVTGLATFARSVAERYPWVEDYTPVNEPLTTARFSALYGHWYPHARDAASFVRALLVECRATCAAMRAVREVNPRARLMQTEDLGTVSATHRLAYQASFENERRFLSLDLLTGRVGREHALWGWLVGSGADPAALEELAAEPMPPDVIGLNYYVTSDRFLDHDVEAYPAHVRGGNDRERYADVEAVRVARGIAGHEHALRALWRRYERPLAITEAHLGGAPEEQIRWLREAWIGAERARREGVDVRAVTLWSVFGAYDWDSLLTLRRGRYEPGAFDVRGGAVRPTALAAVARELATTGESTHPLVAAPGWWRRPERVLHPRAGARAGAASRPVLVAGAAGTLGRAIARACERRGLSVVALGRRELDLLDRAGIDAALDVHRPWAVLNAAGYVRVDEAEGDRAACFRTNVDAAVSLGAACDARGIRYATFSSDLVFDGEKGAAYVERDPTRPLNVYGASKAAAERAVRDACPRALVVRTSAFFGPWDTANFVHVALGAFARREPFLAASDLVVSPTYVPDLADAAITLLVDGAAGLWHLPSGGAVSWAELARMAARAAGITPVSLVACAGDALGWPAKRPRNSALASERGALMRPLDEALAAYVEERGGRR